MAFFDTLAKREITYFGKISNDAVAFIFDRLKVQQREAGVRHDLIDAVFALGGEDDLVRLLARVKALQAFVETTDGENLFAGHKRASHILKKEDGSSVRVERSRDIWGRRNWPFGPTYCYAQMVSSILVTRMIWSAEWLNITAVDFVTSRASEDL